MSPVDTLIFDLDGTISDPYVGISRSINYALQALSYPPVDPERIRPMIGPPLTDIFTALVGELTEQQLRRLVEKYRERYASIGYRENVIYEAMPAVIGELAARGYRLGVCTSKRADYAARIVAMFELDRHIGFVDGGDVGTHKGEQLARLVSGGIAADRAVMIGDRAVDIVAAKANSMRSVGVLWGFGDRAELNAAGPDHILHLPGELTDLFG